MVTHLLAIIATSDIIINVKLSVILGGMGMNQQPQKNGLKWKMPLFTIGLIIILGLVAVVYVNKNPRLTIAAAQEQMDDALESVFAEVDTDIFLVQMLEETVTIKVKSLMPSKDGWYADCIVTSLDLATSIFEYIWSLDATQTDSYANAVADFQNQLANVKVIQQEYRVEFRYIDNAYQAILPEEMVAFCSGNLQDLLPYLMETMLGGINE